MWKEKRILLQESEKQNNNGWFDYYMPTKMVTTMQIRTWHGGDKPMNLFYNNQQHSYQSCDMFDVRLVDREKENFMIMYFFPSNKKSILISSPLFFKN